MSDRSLPPLISSLQALRCCASSAVLLIAMSAQCLAAEQRSGPLESYLKRLAYAPIPLERDDQNHLIARGELEGRNGSFLVDTGCSRTTVDKSAARKLKTIKQLGVELEDSFLGTITNGETVLMRVRLGANVFSNQPALTKGLQLGGKSGQDCILGSDFFSRNFCLIDCSGRRLYVRAAEPPEKVQQALEESLRRMGWQEVKLSLTSNLLFQAEGKANAEPLRLFVDTGAIWTVLDTTQARRLHLYKEPVPARVVGVGKIGSVRIERATVKSFELGNVSFNKVAVGVADLSSWGIRGTDSSPSDVDGLLGAELLALNRALIDVHARKLWLKPRQ